MSKTNHDFDVPARSEMDREQNCNEVNASKADSRQNFNEVNASKADSRQNFNGVNASKADSRQNFNGVNAPNTDNGQNSNEDHSRGGDAARNSVTAAAQKAIPDENPPQQSCENQLPEAEEKTGGQQTYKLLLIPAALLTLTLVIWLALSGFVKDLPTAAALSPTEAPTKYENIFAAQDTAAYPISGKSFGTLTIERAGIEADIIQGDSSVLPETAAGHVLQSALPGEGGRVLLNASHSVYFNALGDVKPGDEVALRTYYGGYRYQVKEAFVFQIGDLDMQSGAILSVPHQSDDNPGAEGAGGTSEEQQSPSQTEDTAEPGEGGDGTGNQSNNADAANTKDSADAVSGSDSAAHAAADNAGTDVSGDEIPAETGADSDGSDGSDGNVSGDNTTDAPADKAAGTSRIEELLLYTYYPFGVDNNTGECYALLCSLIEGKGVQWE